MNVALRYFHNMRRRIQRSLWGWKMIWDSESVSGLRKEAMPVILNILLLKVVLK